MNVGNGSGEIRIQKLFERVRSSVVELPFTRVSYKGVTEKLLEMFLYTYISRDNHRNPIVCVGIVANNGLFRVVFTFHILGDFVLLYGDTFYRIRRPVQRFLFAFCHR